MMNARDLPPMPIGTVYLIDPRLSPDEQRRDLVNIAATGFNTVVLWPATTRWDAEKTGGLAFNSIDRVMSVCDELKLRAIVELQGQVVHQEMTPHSHPDMPAVAQQGSRRDIPWNNPAFQKITLGYLRDVAEHFRGHPALFAYDVFNEVGNDSDDIWARRAFAAFLRRRYRDDISELNEKWGTYLTGFDDIAHYTVEHWSNTRWWSVVPTRDWHAFRHQNFIDLMDEWTAVLREVDPDTPVFADVLGCDTQNDRNGAYYGVNDWDVAEHSDILGLSCYGNMRPQPINRTQPWSWPMFWRTADAAARGRPVMISEMATTNRTVFPIEGSSLTDEIGLWSAQAFFHGVDGLIYWKWRPFRRGVQAGGRGLTAFDGTPNDQAEQAATVAGWVSRHGERLAKLRPDHAGCAIVHDHNTMHLFHALGDTPDELYLDSGLGYYRAFWRHGIQPTFLAGRLLESDGVPDDIRVLVLPCAIALSQKQAEHLAVFLDRGGTLWTDSRFGLLNENGDLWDHAPGGGLHEKLGIEEVRLNGNYVGASRDTGLSLDRELVQDRLKLSSDTEVLLADDAGTPWLIRRRIGAGTHLHSAPLLGQLVRREVDGALTSFDRGYAAVASNLRPAIPIKQLPEAVDISTLLDDRGRPEAVGVTNYQHEAVSIKLPRRLDVGLVEPAHAAEIQRKENSVDVSVPARTAALLLLNPGGVS
ncbi:MAG: beta-galactosidase [Planctomycetota bacterium]